MKKIIVTGAGGYVGVLMCKRLLELGYEVLALDRYYFGTDKMKDIDKHKNLTILKDDIRYVSSSIFSNVYSVIDLVGLSNDASAEIDINLTKEINYQGIERFIHLAKKSGVVRYIFSSSASVYGAGLHKSLNEESKLNPQTEYARSKVAIENVLEKLKDDQFHPVMLRNATIFGVAPRMRFDLAVNIMTYRAWKDRVIYIMGGGDQWRPFIHVSDVVSAFILCLEGPLEKVSGQIFNVGHDSMNVQIKQLAQSVIDLIPNVKIHTIPDDPDKRSYNLSFKKINKILDFEPKFTINEGIIEIKKSLENGSINGEDPTCYTLQWYKSIIAWNERISTLNMYNRIL